MSRDIARVCRIVSAFECVNVPGNDGFRWELLRKKTCFHWRDLPGKLPWKAWIWGKPCCCMRLSWINKQIREIGVGCFKKKKGSTVKAALTDQCVMLCHKYQLRSIELIDRYTHYCQWFWCAGAGGSSTGFWNLQVKLCHSHNACNVTV